jgi:hypothetical protein
MLHPHIFLTLHNLAISLTEHPVVSKHIHAAYRRNIGLVQASPTYLSTLLSLRMDCKHDIYESCMPGLLHELRCVPEAKKLRLAVRHSPFSQ